MSASMPVNVNNCLRGKRQSLHSGIKCCCMHMTSPAWCRLSVDLLAFFTGISTGVAHQMRGSCLWTLPVDPMPVQVGVHKGVTCSAATWDNPMLPWMHSCLLRCYCHSLGGEVLFFCRLIQPLCCHKKYCERKHSASPDSIFETEIILSTHGARFCQQATCRTLAAAAQYSVRMQSSQAMGIRASAIRLAPACCAVRVCSCFVPGMLF